ncbi:hypothetical protein RJZ56_005030 [Blastomyces dermatitidis]
MVFVPISQALEKAIQSYPLFDEPALPAMRLGYGFLDGSLSLYQVVYTISKFSQPLNLSTAGSVTISSDGDGKSTYIMRSENPAIAAIFYNQMNTMDYDFIKEKYVNRKLIYKDGPFKTTIVTTKSGRVRVFKASCNPADDHLTLTYTLHGFWDLSMSTYNKATAQNVAKWLLCYPDPAQTLPLRGL